jgi:hypothetical protein
MQEVKRDSAEWINKNHFAAKGFNWQEGYGAFSHSKTQIDGVVKYIKSQKKRHAQLSSKEELKEILDNLDVDYDEQYLF